MAGVSGPSSSSPTIDLSQLPAPALVARLSYDACFAALLADFQARAPEFDALLPSDPVVKALEVAAYRETLLRGAINDTARSVMLAFAGQSDLDHLAAGKGVYRLVITPATQTEPAVLESDADLRYRAQLAAERLPYAGMTVGGYIDLARRAAPAVKDVALVKRGGGNVDIVLLGRDGDGAVPQPIVIAVSRVLADETATQLTDIVTVRSADIVAYAPTVRLDIRRGPDPELVRASAIAGVRAYAAERHRVGAIVYAQQLAAAASVAGVERAIVDIADVEPGVVAAAWLADLTVTTRVLA